MPRRRCAIACHRQCACDCAPCVTARLPLLGIFHRTRRDLQWLWVCHWGPTLAAATTVMLIRTALSSSARVATCGGAAMYATATTTTTTVIRSITAWAVMGRLRPSAQDVLASAQRPALMPFLGSIFTPLSCNPKQGRINGYTFSRKSSLPFNCCPVHCN